MREALDLLRQKDGQLQAVLQRTIHNNSEDNISDASDNLEEVQALRQEVTSLRELARKTEVHNVHLQNELSDAQVRFSRQTFDFEAELRKRTANEEQLQAQLQLLRGNIASKSCQLELEELRNDEVIKSSMPGEMYKVYEHYKRDEWEKYNATVTDWAVETYLDCLP